MNNNTRTSSRDQVKQFLLSDQSLNYKLDSYDVAILYAIAGYIDMPMKVCFAKPSQIWEEAKCGKRTFERRIVKLLKDKILFRYKPKDDKRDHYLLGETITGIYL